MSEFILVRNPVNASNVGKPSLVLVTLRNMEGLTLERIPKYRI
jgi:hypothetical protein